MPGEKIQSEFPSIESYCMFSNLLLLKCTLVSDACLDGRNCEDLNNLLRRLGFLHDRFPEDLPLDCLGRWLRSDLTPGEAGDHEKCCFLGLKYLQNATTKALERRSLKNRKYEFLLLHDAWLTTSIKQNSVWGTAICF